MKSELIHDWNTVGGAALPNRIEYLDETLAEGLQSTTVRTPGDDARRQLLALAVTAGFDTINVGRHAGEAFVQWVRDRFPQVRMAVSTDALEQVHIDRVLLLGGVSEVRVHAAVSDCVLTAEGVNLTRRLAEISMAVERLALGANPPVWVAEDATRTSPATLATALEVVQKAGAKRVCLADSVGTAMPLGVARLFGFVRERAPELAWDWAGRNDRGLAVANALTAVHHGGARICGTALGLGEGAGVIPLDALLTNVALLRDETVDLVALKEYCFKVAERFGARIPVNYPVLGSDAFRTATGVHAAAIVKARKKGDAWLVDRVYSGIPAAWFGLQQRIDIGPMSGLSNVSCWLEDRGLQYGPDDVSRVLQRAKQSNRTLTEEEVLQVLKETPLTD